MGGDTVGAKPSVDPLYRMARWPHFRGSDCM